MKQRPKISKEDYLRVMYSIYEAQEDKKLGIKSIDISKALNITKPSVSDMLRKLAKKRFIKFSPYSNIFFTNKGLKEAVRITHNHRVIEVFLRKMLKYGLSKIHEKSKIHKEANHLEHAFSDESIKRLDNFLNNPKISPYGNKIPRNIGGKSYEKSIKSVKQRPKWSNLVYKRQGYCS